MAVCTLESHNHYTVDLFGSKINTTVTHVPSVIRKWLSTTLFFRRAYLHKLIVGMGVQWYPSSDDEAATLQICIGKRCLIVQLSHCDYIPKLLRRFLANPNYTFVGIWNHSDAARLQECKHGLDMGQQPLDLRRYVLTEDGQSLIQASFETIVEEVLGYEGVALEQSISVSDWEKSTLSKDQVAQATVDSYCSFLIGKRMEAWNFSNMRLY